MRGEDLPRVEIACSVACRVMGCDDEETCAVHEISLRAEAVGRIFEPWEEWLGRELLVFENVQRESAFFEIFVAHSDLFGIKMLDLDLAERNVALKIGVVISNLELTGSPSWG